MDKSMTGDGAVVLDHETAKQSAVRCVSSGVALTWVINLARAYLEREAEIERLKTGWAFGVHMCQRMGQTCADLKASEARTADLLKALKPFAALDVSEIQPDPARGTYLIEQGAIRNARAAIAAAKGETV